MSFVDWKKNLIRSFPQVLILHGYSKDQNKDTVLELIHGRECEVATRGSCLNCKSIAEANHPDVMTTASEQKEISIDQIREGLKWLYIAPNQFKLKYWIIATANALSQNSANALLKTLEEPPPHARFVLISLNLHELLPTIRSRALVIRVPEPTGFTESSESTQEWRSITQQFGFSSRFLFAEAWKLVEPHCKDRQKCSEFLSTLHDHLLSSYLNLDSESRKIHSTFIARYLKKLLDYADGIAIKNLNASSTTFELLSIWSTHANHVA